MLQEPCLRNFWSCSKRPSIRLWCKSKSESRDNSWEDSQMTRSPGFRTTIALPHPISNHPSTICHVFRFQFSFAGEGLWQWCLWLEIYQPITVFLRAVNALQRGLPHGRSLATYRNVPLMRRQQATATCMQSIEWCLAAYASMVTERGMCCWHENAMICNSK